MRLPAGMAGGQDARAAAARRRLNSEFRIQNSERRTKNEERRIQFFLYDSFVVTGAPPPWKSGRVESIASVPSAPSDQICLVSNDVPWKSDVAISTSLAPSQLAFVTRSIDMPLSS